MFTTRRGGDIPTPSTSELLTELQPIEHEQSKRPILIYEELESSIEDLDDWTFHEIQVSLRAMIRERRQV